MLSHLFINFTKNQAKNPVYARADVIVEEVLQNLRTVVAFGAEQQEADHQDETRRRRETRDPGLPGWDGGFPPAAPAAATASPT